MMHKIQQLLKSVMKKHTLHHTKTFRKLLSENKADYKTKYLVQIVYVYQIGRQIEIKVYGYKRLENIY